MPPPDAATRRVFTSLVAAACMDGRLSDPERQFLTCKAAEFGIEAVEAAELMQQGLQGRFTVAIPPSQAGKEALLDELLETVCVDGRVESQEKQLLLRFASHVGVNPGDLGVRVRERLNQKQNEPAHPQVPQTPARPPRREPPVGKREPRPDPPKPAPIEIKPIDSPVPVLMTEPPRNPLLENQENLLNVPPGPITLSGPEYVADELPVIARELVKNAIRVDGRDGAIAYLKKMGGIEDAAKAAAMVDKLIADDPSCVPGALKIRTGH